MFECNAEDERENDDENENRIVAIGIFIDWAKAYPQYRDEPPVDTEVRFLTESDRLTPNSDSLI